MNKYIVYNILFFGLIFNGCKSKETIALNDVKSCINRSLSEIQGKAYSKDNRLLEETLINFEEYLLKQKYLKSIDKSSYIELIYKIVESPKKYSEIYKEIKNTEKYEDNLILLNPTLILNQCNNHVLVTRKNDYNSTLNLQSKVIPDIMFSNYSNINRINELVYVTSDKDFEELIYRIPFIYIITMNAEKNDYSEEELGS